MNWKDDLKKLESDNSTGSAELLEQCIELLLYRLGKGEIQTPKDKSFLMDQIKRLQDSHMSLFVLLHFSFQAIQLLNKSGEDWKPEFVNFLNEYRDKWTGVNIRLAMQARAAIDLNQKLILCHSQSSAVREIFEAYQGNRKKVKIIQTESRPIMEGRIQAVNILKLGYEVKLISDTGYARHLDRINMILLGADAIIFAWQLKTQASRCMSLQILENSGSACHQSTRKSNIMKTESREKKSGKIHTLAWM
jgi:translation initiation factor 2B subunit (eIF-2B alpha/beta/delta family)